MLYESYIHPITILSTLPSAGVGALLALLLMQHRAQRHRAHRHHPAHRHREEERDHDDRLRARGRARRGPDAATRRSTEACLLRFRPIMMTTMAALLGALPLALGTGAGLGAAPAARHRDRRRPDRQPAADALHDAGDLPGDGPAAPAIRAAPPASFDRGSAGLIRTISPRPVLQCCSAAVPQCGTRAELQFGQARRACRRR